MPEYVLDQATGRGLEEERLRALQEFYRPTTLRGLDAVGVGPGWRCWDVGTGSAPIALELAERVGPTGQVIATDLDTTLAEWVAAHGVDVRVHDVMAEPPVATGLDLVHTRLLLMHLPAPAEVVARFADALRPGGWVVLGDFDGTGFAVHTGAREATRVWELCLAVMTDAGAAIDCGPQLPGLLRDAGFVDVAGESYSEHSAGSSPHPRLAAMTAQRLRDRILRTGRMDPEEVDRGIGQLLDPRHFFTSPTTWTVWGRRAR